MATAKKINADTAEASSEVVAATTAEAPAEAQTVEAPAETEQQPAVSINPWQAAETKVKAILADKDQDAQLKAVEKTTYNEVSLLVSMIVVPGMRKPLEDKHGQAHAAALVNAASRRLQMFVSEFNYASRAQSGEAGKDGIKVYVQRTEGGTQGIELGMANVTTEDAKVETTRAGIFAGIRYQTTKAPAESAEAEAYLASIA